MKKYFVICIFIAVIFPLLAEDFFERFLETNNSLASGTGFVAVQKLIESDLRTGKTKITNAESIFSGDKEFTVLHDKNDFYILSTSDGYWIQDYSMSSAPIKASGSYAVDEIQMQDILRIDFQNDYKIEEKSENEILLRRVNRKNPYEYILISEEVNSHSERSRGISGISDGEKESFYFARYLDKKKKEIKQIKYFESEIDGVKCFSEIRIQNSVVMKNKISSFITERLKPVEISPSLFKPEWMGELKKILESEMMLLGAD